MNGLRYYTAMSSIKDKKGLRVSWINQLKSTFLVREHVYQPTRFSMSVANLVVQVTRKPIKHLHLRLTPSDEAIRVSAPLFLSEAQIRAQVLSRLTWIEAKRALFSHRTNQQRAYQFVTNEVHYYLGEPYRLVVDDQVKRASVTVKDAEKILLLAVPATANGAKRQAVLTAFYRAALKTMIPHLLAKWQPVLGVEVADWGVKAMRTRWGTCNTRDKRVWLSLMLAKAPHECIEYVMVHELVHLLERNHTPRFHALMTQFLPEWPELAEQLKRVALVEVGL